jgi:hypothetical protein
MVPVIQTEGDPTADDDGSAGADESRPRPRRAVRAPLVPNHP